MLKIDDLTSLGYRFDRLNTDDKLVLCTQVLTALLHGDIIESIDSKIIDDLIIIIENYLFILMVTSFIIKKNMKISFKKDFSRFFLV